MPSLQLLFLNANLLRSLPLGVFSGVNLARLNLRNNHFLQLPTEGVLEHLTGLVQVGANLKLYLMSDLGGISADWVPTCACVNESDTWHEPKCILSSDRGGALNGKY